MFADFCEISVCVCMFLRRFLFFCCRSKKRKETEGKVLIPRATCFVLFSKKFHRKLTNFRRFIKNFSDHLQKFVIISEQWQKRQVSMVEKIWSPPPSQVSIEPMSTAKAVTLIFESKWKFEHRTKGDAVVVEVVREAYSVLLEAQAIAKSDRRSSLLFFKSMLIFKAQASSF